MVQKSANRGGRAQSLREAEPPAPGRGGERNRPHPAQGTRLAESGPAGGGLGGIPGCRLGARGLAGAQLSLPGRVLGGCAHRAAL